MKVHEKLIEIAKTNNGVVQTQQAVDAGIHKAYLARAVKSGDFEKIASGVYLLNGYLEDDLYLLQLKWTKIIFSHTTSAYFNELTTRDPIVLTFTVPFGSNVTGLVRAGHKAYFCSKQNYELGLTKTETMFGNTIRIYDAERTICDIFSARFTGDYYVALESLKAYLTSKAKNINKLMKYAKQLGVEKNLCEKIQVMSI